MSVKSYRDLIVWQKAMDLAELIYRATAKFPKDELYGLAQQVRRAAVSIPSNIAEGQGRRTTREFLHFLSVENGSLNEAETQILLAERLKYIDSEESATVLAQSSEVRRLTCGLVNALNTKD